MLPCDQCLSLRGIRRMQVWLRQQDVGLQSSLAKLQAVEGVCAALDVRTAPARIGAGLWVVPIVSWHHRSFDQEPDIPGIPPVSRLTIADYAACRWPRSMLGGWVGAGQCSIPGDVSGGDAAARTVCLPTWLDSGAARKCDMYVGVTKQ